MEVARELGISQRAVQRVLKEPPVQQADDAVARRQRRVGRPSVVARVSQRLQELLQADAEARPLEYLRQMREEGIRLGESTFYRVYRIEKKKLPAELMVRFEGVADEFAQFDFGGSHVRLLDGRRQRPARALSHPPRTPSRMESPGA